MAQVNTKARAKLRLILEAAEQPMKAKDILEHTLMRGSKLTPHGLGQMLRYLLSEGEVRRHGVYTPHTWSLKPKNGNGKHVPVPATPTAVASAASTASVPAAVFAEYALSDNIMYLVMGTTRLPLKVSP